MVGARGTTTNCLVLKYGSESKDGVVGEEGEEEEANGDDGDEGRLVATHCSGRGLVRGNVLCTASRGEVGPAEGRLFGEQVSYQQASHGMQ